MESKDELKEIDTKNPSCFYFDDAKRVDDIHGLRIDVKELDLK